MKKVKAVKNPIRILIINKKLILDQLRRVIKNGNFNYRTFGTAIENYLSDILIRIFKKNSLIKSSNDYILAPDKNYFPDFELKTNPSIAIEYKSGNSSKLLKGKWITCKNSNNDMGTLSVWPAKLKKFGGENIYYIFVIYNFNDKVKEIVDVQIALFYKFIGLNKAGFLKYREKDGNLRPRDFYEEQPIKTFNQFQNLLNKTIVYRSKGIIKKHQTILKALSPKS